MVFADGPEQEPKTAKEEDAQITKSKLPQYTGPFHVIWAFPHLIVMDHVGAALPVSVDSAPKHPLETRLRRHQSRI